MTLDEEDNSTAAYSYGLARIKVEAMDNTRPDSQVPLYYLYDGLGSTTQLVRANGAVRDHYSYDEFGDTIGAKLSEDGRNVNYNTFGYTGERWDEEDDLLYLRSRYYAPQIGRFMTRDTFPGYAVNPLSMHKYAYVENDPVNFVDPLGFSKKELKLTDKMKSAGVKIVTRRDGTQLYDFSKAINQMIWRNALLCKEQRDDYYSGLIGGAKSVLPYDLLNWFKGKVDSGKPWDLKIPGRWKEQMPELKEFDVKDANDNFNEFVLNGEVITAEDLGNITYGYWGRATGFGDTLLYSSGGYVAVGKNADDPRIYDPTQYYGDTKQDHYMIKRGIDWYESSFGNDNPPFDPGLTTIRVLLEGLDAKTDLYNEIDDLKKKLPWN